MMGQSNQTAKVGQAVYDILSKPTHDMQNVGETLDAMTPRYYKELFDTFENNRKQFSSPFYIVVLRKKEPWALNVLRQWYIARQSKPSARVLRKDYPNHDHDVWEADSKADDVRLLWTLPTSQDAQTILTNKGMYQEDVVECIEKFNAGLIA
jgi:REP element-mobilizing transposase RayT